MRISDWSSDVCSSDLTAMRPLGRQVGEQPQPNLSAVGPFQHFGMLEIKALPDDRVQRLEQAFLHGKGQGHQQCPVILPGCGHAQQFRWSEDFTAKARSEEHTYELQSLMRSSYA